LFSSVLSEIRCSKLLISIEASAYIFLFSYAYSGSTVAITEMDGVRVLGEDVCDLIQKVPGMPPIFCAIFCWLSWIHFLSIFFIASTLSIFKPGSTSPSAILYDAWESFTKKSPKADESIRSIRPELAKAVDECIDAAGQEWEPHWQRRLLNVGHIFFSRKPLQILHNSI